MRQAKVTLNLYTILLDYRGGTYIAQLSATSPAEALVLWTEQLPTQRVPGIRAATASELAFRLQQEAPVELRGLVNAWCTSALIRGGHALINIVLTRADAG